jgi:hypothetical protein
LRKIPRSSLRQEPLPGSLIRPLPGFFDLTQTRTPVWAGALPMSRIANVQKAASAITVAS